jgi:hypothetical protein
LQGPSTLDMTYGPLARQAWFFWHNEQDAQRPVIHFLQSIITALAGLQRYLSSESPWKLGTKQFNLRWHPHNLDQNQKTERLAKSEELLQILEESQQKNFVVLPIGDESRFF